MQTYLLQHGHPVAFYGVIIEGIFQLQMHNVLLYFITQQCTLVICSCTLTDFEDVYLLHYLLLLLILLLRAQLEICHYMSMFPSFVICSYSCCCFWSFCCVHSWKSGTALSRFPSSLPAAAAASDPFVASTVGDLALHEHVSLLCNLLTLMLLLLILLLRAQLEIWHYMSMFPSFVICSHSCCCFWSFCCVHSWKSGTAWACFPP